MRLIGTETRKQRHLSEYITENQQCLQKFLRMWLMYFFSDL